MSKTVRVTKAQKWNAVIAVLDAIEAGEDYNPIKIPGTDKADGVVLDIPTLRTFAKDELDLLSRKNNNGDKAMTQTQKDNEHYKELIYAYLTEEDGRTSTCFGLTKVIPELEGFTTSKVSALLRAMGNDEKLAKGRFAGTVDSKTEGGKKLFFVVAEPAEAENEGEGE